LSPGDIGVAPNQPKTVYYVIRAVDFTPSPDELWNSFREGPDMQSIYRVASRDQQETMRAWMTELKTSVNIVRETGTGSLPKGGGGDFPVQGSD
jgi:hypothetical protein